MDPASFAASVLALAETTFTVVEYLNNVKEGGKQRFKLLAEVTSLWNALDSLHSSLEHVENSKSTPTIKILFGLSKPDGLLAQCKTTVDLLLKKLQLSSQTKSILTALKWPFDKQQAQDSIDRVHRLQTTISLKLAEANLVLSQEIRDDSYVIRKQLDEEYAHKVTEWLSPLNFLAQQDAVQKEFCSGTGTWLLESNEFKQWESAEESVLWCAGMAGSGKTFLASMVVHEREKLASNSQHRILVVYCRFDDPDYQKAENIMGGLVKQTIRNASDMSAELIKLYEDYLPRKTRPSPEEMATALACQLEAVEKVYVVIDALDELIAEKDREILLQSMKDMRRPINLLVFSRDLDVIRIQLRAGSFACGKCEENTEETGYSCELCLDHNICDSCYQPGENCKAGEFHGSMRKIRYALMIKMEADESDITRYLTWRIASDQRIRGLVSKREGLQELIITSLIVSSKSMFLLARLAIENLSTCLTIRDIKESIRQLPDGLSAAYNQTMDRINKQDHNRSKLAYEVLRWALISKRPMTSREMEQAVGLDRATQEFEQDDVVPASLLVSLCAGLIFLDHKDCISWIHYSTEEHFKKHPDFLASETNRLLARSCLTFMMLPTFAAGPCETISKLFERKEIYPFYKYAVSHWFDHLMASEDDVNKEMTVEFLESQPLRDSATQCLWDSTRGPLSFDPGSLSSTPALHLAAYLGLEYAVRHFLDKDECVINCEDVNGATPLILAAFRNHVSVGKLLLERGARVNVVASRGATAIHTAVYKGFTHFLEMVLESPEVDVIIPLSAKGAIPGEFNDYLKAHCSEANFLVRMPLKVPRDTPMDFAARAGRDDYVKMLLAHESSRKVPRSRRIWILGLALRNRRKYHHGGQKRRCPRPDCTINDATSFETEDEVLHHLEQAHYEGYPVMFSKVGIEGSETQTFWSFGDDEHGAKRGYFRPLPKEHPGRVDEEIRSWARVVGAHPNSHFMISPFAN